jgi:hypothetical protein
MRILVHPVKGRSTVAPLILSISARLYCVLRVAKCPASFSCLDPKHVFGDRRYNRVTIIIRQLLLPTACQQIISRHSWSIISSTTLQNRTGGMTRKPKPLAFLKRPQKHHSTPYCAPTALRVDRLSLNPAHPCHPCFNFLLLFILLLSWQQLILSILISRNGSARPIMVPWQL